MSRMSTSERFWSKVQPAESGCWHWIGFVGPKGYGNFKVNGRLVRAHRMAWELTFNPIPEGKFVCHHCDNRKCVNPEHLFIGDAKVNMHDAMSKGRVKNPPVWNKAFSLERERDIYVRITSGAIGSRRMAKECGVSRRTIQTLLRRHRAAQP